MSTVSVERGPASRADRQYVRRGGVREAAFLGAERARMARIARRRTRVLRYALPSVAAPARPPQQQG